jgi:hypothetical protein
MKLILGAILRETISRCFGWVERILRRRDYAKRQKKRDDAHADPGRAFADHFGVRGVPDDAAKTGKTKP